MGVRATQEVSTLPEVLDALGGILLSNLRWMRANRVINIRDGFVYRLISNDACGAEFWPRVYQILHQPRPIAVECETASTILCAALRASGDDPGARLRAIQIETTAHIQVVSRGRVLDPSVWLGMPVPAHLKTAIYDLNFPGAVVAP